jgi:pimeloyl-ACP methyl ester carboxylesterase
LSHNDSQRSPAKVNSYCWISLESRSTVPYFCNYTLAAGAVSTRALVVMHGINRNADDYFRSIGRAATSVGANDAVIVAPHFLIEEDERRDHDAYWTDSGETSWKDGGGAVAPPGLSSFTVMDQILTMLANKDQFPLLTSITLIGHSAGGQFIQRYAAGGRAPCALADVTIRYVVANPSSYLYLNSYRPVEGDPRKVCPEYNNYKYGLEKRNKYFNPLSDAQIRRQYIGRRVIYMLGDADVNRDDNLEINCAANVQGKNRFQRGCFYYSFIQTYFPSAAHDMVVVPGVGHDHDAMFNSTQGKSTIFGNQTAQQPCVAE